MGLGVEPTRQRLSQCVRRESDHARRTARAGQHRRLDQALGIKSHVIGGGTQHPLELRNSLSEGPGTRPPGDPLVDHGHQIEQREIFFIHKPVKASLGEPGAESGGHRQGVDDVAQGAETDDQDRVHGVSCERAALQARPPHPTGSGQ